MNYYSHSKNQYNIPGLLRDHLIDVAKRAAEHAKNFGADAEAYLAGILHDLGKYGDLFQERLKNPRKVRRIDHWSIGAWVALTKYKLNGIAAALSIQGHHIGLQKGNPDSLKSINPEILFERHPDGLRLSESTSSGSKLLLDRFNSDNLELPLRNYTSIYNPKKTGKAAGMLDVRMLYSSLVDADFIETEAFFNSDEAGRKIYRKSGKTLEPEKALSILDKYIKNISIKSNSVSEVNQMRKRLLNDCLSIASEPVGLFTLTAPTGSGKTLSMLSFALKHAINNNLDRIIFVIPYLSIIEQTASIYKDIFYNHFGDDYILEHHSLSNTHKNEYDDRGHELSLDDDAYYKRNFLTENWDAPIIITTSVQLLESLFSNKPSVCRKLHNLANAVILFDEVQTLPTSLCIPTLASLSHLSKRYNSTILFSTATQPAFTVLDGHVKKFAFSGWEPKEIVTKENHLFNIIKRTSIMFPELDHKISWGKLAKGMESKKQVLYVVNLKRHAIALFDELKNKGVDNLYHLSTNMCPAHRQKTLQKVRDELNNNKPCCLVSTQCIEAGVDIDFPFVYRAMAPLDAIAQAAGRCNRNGKTSKGIVTIFVPDDEKSIYPGGAYEQATSVTLSLLKELNIKTIDELSPDLFNRYYKKLYNINEPHNKNTKLIDAIKCQDFITVSQEYKIIKSDTINVLVPYNIEICESLKKEAQETGLTRKWIAKSKPYIVSLYRPKKNSDIWCQLDSVPVNYRKDEADDWFIYLDESHYDKEKGLITKDKDVLIA